MKGAASRGTNPVEQVERSLMDTLLQDVRYGARMLRRHPAFSLVAILALGLGIGANTAIFSVVNSVLLAPLPFRDPDRLVLVWNSYPGLNLPRAAVAAPDFTDRRDQNRVFEAVAVSDRASYNMATGGEPERVQGARVSATLFPLLGREPVRGRAFTPEEDRPGNERVVMLAYGLWQRRFGGRDAVVGSTISLNGNPHTVIGVMPPKFAFPAETELWTPIALTAAQTSDEQRGHEYLLMVARLKPGVTLQQAEADMDAIVRRVIERAPAQFVTFLESSGWNATVVPLAEQVVGDVRPALLVLLGAVGFVLLMACANVANLLLVRASGRQREISIRTALGAGRTRVIRQLLTESILLALAGAVVGVLVGAAGIRLLVAASPADIPRIDEVAIDRVVLLFTLGVAVATGLLFGLVPALHASRPDLNETLKEGGRGSTAGSRGRRARGLLVVAEVGLALVLLVGAGLLLQSFQRLQQVDPGFHPANVLTLRLSLAETKHPKPADQVAFFERVLDRLQALPGVEHVGAVSGLPLSGDNETRSFAAERTRLGPNDPSPLCDFRIVTPGLLSGDGDPAPKGALLHAGRYARCARCRHRR